MLKILTSIQIQIQVIKLILIKILIKKYKNKIIQWIMIHFINNLNNKYKITMLFNTKNKIFNNNSRIFFNNLEMILLNKQMIRLKIWQMK